MKITFYADNRLLECHVGDFTKDIVASCDVRNELNKRRALHNPKEVVYAMVDDHYNKYAYMPRMFPAGTWGVWRPRKGTSSYLEPFFIPTDAEQLVETWRLDPDGGYDQPQGYKVMDIGYGLHFSESMTTLGCIRIHQRDDLLWLVNVINDEILQGHSNTITV